MKIVQLLSFLLVVSLSFSVVGISSGEDESSERLVEPHQPIFFDGSLNAEMVPDGMIGNGTEVDPFIVSGHWINTSSSPGLVISNSSYHILVYLNLFTNGSPQLHPAISIKNSSNVHVSNVASYYCSRGVEVLNSTDITVSDSGFFGSYDGIYIQGEDITIKRTICKVNVENGILINRSGNVTIEDAISESNTAILGVTSGIHIVDSSDIKIIGTTCSLNYGYGILAEPSDPSVRLERIEITDSYIDSNNNGIVMTNIHGSSIGSTIIKYNTNGVYLSSSDGLVISDCIFQKNTYGAFLSGSEDITINGSRFDRNENAIYLDSTKSSDIFENIFENGTWHAITIDTWLGIGPPSRNNSVHENEFYDNGPIGCQVMDNGEMNRWSVGSTGNLWSDHGGPDLNDDSIVDEPYVIAGMANASDMFPRAFDKGAVIVNDDDGDDSNVQEVKRDGMNFWVLISISGVLILILIVPVMMGSRRGGR